MSEENEGLRMKSSIYHFKKQVVDERKFCHCDQHADCEHTCDNSSDMSENDNMFWFKLYLSSILIAVMKRPEPG